MNRARFDWLNMEPLPRRERDTGATREDLAARKFYIAKAKHKGRNHITNAKRRQIAKEIAGRKQIGKAIKAEVYRRFVDAIRAYWRGEADEHPTFKGDGR